MHIRIDKESVALLISGGKAENGDARSITLLM
jgi:hypothetical protein